MKKHLISISLLLLFLLSIQPLSAATLDVTITHIRSDKGTMLLAIFTSSEQFKTEKPYKSIILPKTNLKDGCLTLQIPIAAGVYGLSVLDDENNNQQVDYNFIGFPTEGFAFSNYKIKILRKPKFEDFSFVVKEDEVVSIAMKIRYVL